MLLTDANLESQERNLVLTALQKDLTTPRVSQDDADGGHEVSLCEVWRCGWSLGMGGDHNHGYVLEHANPFS